MLVHSTFLIRTHLADAVLSGDFLVSALFSLALFCGRFSRIGDRAGRRSPLPFARERFRLPLRPFRARGRVVKNRDTGVREKSNYGCTCSMRHVASMYRAGSAARAPRCVEQARSAALRVRGVGSLGSGEVGGAWCARAACVAQHIPTFLILRLRRSTRRRRGAADARGARRGACRHAWGRRPGCGHRGAAAAHGRHLPRGMLGAARGNRRGHRSAEAQHLRFEAVVSPGGRRPLLAAAAAAARAERSLRL